MRKNRKNNSRTRGKRICIVAILLASSLILAGCGIKKEEIEDSELPEIVIGIDYFEPYSYQTDVGRILRTFKIKKNVEVTDNGKIII